MRRALASLLFAAASVAWAQPFEFVAIVDIPYGRAEQVGKAYENLIGLINRERVPFTIHIGDFKDGSSACSDDEFARQKSYFDRFDTALVYTPGDNEWTDCHRESAGRHDPIERLARLREMYFSEARSLGRQPIAVERQGDAMPAYALYRENLRWATNGVLFATVHIVGSNNNFEVRDLRAAQEFFARDAANVAWIRAAFDKAGADGAKAIVFAIQGDVFDLKAYYADFPGHSGYRESIGATLLPLAERSRLPVLLIHGDSHRFVIDRPFRNERGQQIPNLWRLEVFGAREMHAVKVRVDPGASGVFGFTPIWNPLSPDVGAR